MRCMRLAAMQIQDAKNRHLGTIAQLCRAMSSQLRHVSTIGKKLVKQISTGFASWQRYCTASTSGRQANFAALNTGRHLCSAGRPSGWALAHILVYVYFVLWYICFDWWMCAFVVLGLVFPYQAKRLVWGTSPKWLFCVEWDIKPVLGTVPLIR